MSTDSFAGKVAFVTGGTGGLGQAIASALEVTPDDWDSVVDVNLRGVFFSAQSGAQQMVRRGRGGKVVRIASIMGLVGGSTVAYGASQAGVANLTRVLAIEWAAHNIQVNGVRRCRSTAAGPPGNRQGISGPQRPAPRRLPCAPRRAQ